jgi:hypothetical protein
MTWLLNWLGIPLWQASIIGLCSVLALVITITWAIWLGRRLSSSHELRTPLMSTPIPPEELAETIRKWLDDFHYQVQKSPVKEEKYFSLIVRGRNPNIPVEVMRTKKDREQFVTLLGTVRINDVDKAKLDCLPERNRQLIFRKMRLELSRQKIPSSMDSSYIALETRVLIDELTQVKLIDRIDDVDYAITLISLKFKLLLDEEEDRNTPKEEGPPQS